MKTREVSALCWVSHVHEHLGEVRATIRGLPMRRQAQRDTVTCLRSHSMEVLVLTVEPLCFRRVAQGNQQPPAPTHPGRGSWGGRGTDRWLGTQDPVSTPPWTMKAKSLSLPRKLMAPARPSLESAAKHLAFSSDPSGPWGHPPHSPELWLPWATSTGS